MNLPRMIRVRQKFDASVLRDIAKEIALQIARLGLEGRIKPGQRVAVACGSRGIANHSLIVEATIHALQRAGLEPFVVPAMGSHGAATAEGQKRVLEDYGISEEKLGVAIRSSLEVVKIGEVEGHIPVWVDRLALEADHIVPVNRIKSHTDFESDFGSGLIKLMVIGLGKRKGASTYHQAFFEFGYPRVILSAARKILESGKILFGVGVIENGYCQTARIAVLQPEELEEREKELFREASRVEPRLPFEDVDILVIDELGKDISGSGIDSKVIGRIHAPLLSREPETPRVKRIIVRDLTANTEGNAVGVGLADFVTKRLVGKMDPEATYVNAITSGCPEQAKIPITAKNDREALELAAATIGMVAPEALRLMRIKSTKHLGEADVSRAYRRDLSKRRDLEIVADQRPWVFDREGNLSPFEGV